MWYLQSEAVDIEVSFSPYFLVPMKVVWKNTLAYDRPQPLVGRGVVNASDVESIRLVPQSNHNVNRSYRIHSKLIDKRMEDWSDMGTSVCVTAVRVSPVTGLGIVTYCRSESP